MVSDNVNIFFLSTYLLKIYIYIFFPVNLGSGDGDVKVKNFLKKSTINLKLEKEPDERPNISELFKLH